MPAPALRIPVAFDMDSFRRQTKSMGDGVDTVLRQVTKKFIDANASIATQANFAGAAIGGLRTALGAFGPLALAIGTVAAAFKVMNYATELAKEKIEEYNGISKTAATTGLTPEYFQRLSRAQDDMKLSTDDLTEALQKLKRTSDEKLGGSDLQKRVDELQKAGNFQGNTGVDALRSAVTAEEKFKAINSLIAQALEKGERLAALDISQTAFGSKTTDNLRENSGYLSQLERSAESIAAQRLVSGEDVGRAIDLKNRMEEAQKILAQKWKPIQDDLAKLGMNYQESWVDIYETLSNAVGAATKFYDVVKKLPGLLNQFGNLQIFKDFNDFMARYGMGGPLPGAAKFDNPQESALDSAKARLATLMGDRNNMKNGMREALDIQTRVRGDTSKDPGRTGNADTGSTRDRFDASADSIEKRTAALTAETMNIDLNTAARERAKVAAELQTVAMQINKEAGLGANVVTAEQQARIDTLAEAYGRAAEKMEQARAPLATFARESANVSKQLNQFAAQSLDGMTNSLADVVTGTQTAAQAFKNFANSVINDLIRIAIRKSITGPIAGLLDTLFNPVGAATGGLSLTNHTGLYAGGGMISGSGSGTSDSILARVSNGEYVVKASEARRNKPLLDLINSGMLPQFAAGGMVSYSPTAESPSGETGSGTVLA